MVFSNVVLICRHATLPAHRMRRATGVPGPSRRMPTYEDTEIESQPPQQSHSSSASPNKANLHKSSSPASPYHIGGAQRKSREGSPKLPSPYQSRKKQLTVTQSTGDVMELPKRNLGGSQHSSQHSSNSSLNQLSDTDAYEPIADFLRVSSTSSTSSAVPLPSGAVSENSTPPKPQNVEALIGGPPAPSAQSFNAPSYPAPVPPESSAAPPIPRKTRVSEHFAGGAEEEEEDDDDGYTQVNLEGGQVDIQDFTDGVERAVLPLLSSSSTRSSMVGGDSSGSSPMRNERRRSPPDVVPTGFIGSGSPQSSKFGATKGGISMPPEPTSPPPSPPKGGRVSADSADGRQNPCSPPVSRQGKVGGGMSPISPPKTEEQPKLPPKKRSKKPSVSSSLMKDEDIYAFDNLSTPNPGPTLSASPPVDDAIYSFDTLEKPAERPPQVPKKSESFKSTFSSSVKSRAPYQPKYPVPSSVEKSASPFTPSYNDENIYEFDSLEEPPPVAPKKVTQPPSFRQTGFNVSSPQLTPKQVGSKSPSTSPVAALAGRSAGGGAASKPNNPPPIPQKSTASSSRSSFVGTPGSRPPPTSYQFHDDQDIYTFDKLEESAPSIPKKPAPTPGRTEPVPERPKVQMHDDENIYSFDSLEPAQHDAMGLSPETGQSGDVPLSSGGGEAAPDDIYFDHLVTGQPPPPATGPRPFVPPRPSPSPKLPSSKPSKPPPPAVLPKTSPPALRKPSVSCKAMHVYISRDSTLM